MAKKRTASPPSAPAAAAPAAASPAPTEPAPATPPAQPTVTNTNTNATPKPAPTLPPEAAWFESYMFPWMERWWELNYQEHRFLLSVAKSINDPQAKPPKFIEAGYRGPERLCNYTFLTLTADNAAGADANAGVTNRNGDKPPIFSLSAKETYIFNMDSLRFLTFIAAMEHMHPVYGWRENEIIAYCKACMGLDRVKFWINEVTARRQITVVGNMETSWPKLVLHSQWMEWLVDYLGASPDLVMFVQRLTTFHGKDGLKVIFANPKYRTLLAQLCAGMGMAFYFYYSLDLLLGSPGSRKAIPHKIQQTWENIPWKTCKPKIVCPQFGWLIGDMQTVLLELCVEPAQVKQNYEIYQSHVKRLAETLAPLPEPFHRDPDALESLENRAAYALAWCRSLGLLTVSKSSDKGANAQKNIIALNENGEKWRKLPVREQWTTILEHMNAKIEIDKYKYYGTNENQFKRFNAFTGIPFAIKTKQRYGGEKEDLQLLEEFQSRMERFFESMPEEQFVLWEDVLNVANNPTHDPVFGDVPTRNAEFLSSTEETVTSFVEGANLTTKVFEDLLRKRFAPMGFLRIGVDAQGRVCVARMPRMATWFLKQLDRDYWHVPEIPQNAQTKVIIQPDFSITFIGYDPAPMYELAPFCDRPTAKEHVHDYTNAAHILKITRDSVTRAINNGHSPDSVVDAFLNTATQTIPPNVLKEIQHWAEWIKPAVATDMVVLTCETKDASERVLNALGNHAFRLGDLHIALKDDKITSTDRQKLLKMGILLKDERIPKK